MKGRVLYLLGILGISFFAILVNLLLLASPLRAADQCVNPAGSDGCLASIQAAVNAAGSGDTVRVMVGTYIETVTITKNLTLLGGYDDVSFTSRTPRTSIVDGAGNHTVFAISGGADVTLDGFTVTGGDGSTHAGEGGGIAIHQATAQILDNLIEANIASRDENLRGRGGGIDVISSTAPVLIAGNTIQNNTAYSVTLTAPPTATFGLGGGVWVDIDSTAVISDNEFLGNTAARTDIVESSYGGGGAIGSFGSTNVITIVNNLIEGNKGNAVGRSEGGGIVLFGLLTATIQGNTVVQNQAAQAGFARGGGIYISAVEGRITGNTIEDNIASQASDSNNVFAGGLYAAVTQLTLQDNMIAHNTALVSGFDGQGGGLYINAAPGPNPSMSVTGNWVLSNTAVVTATGAAPFASGGGIRVWGGKATNASITLQDNHIIGNRTAQSMTPDPGTRGQVDGGGLAANMLSATHVISNEIRANVAVNHFQVSGSGGWGGRTSGGAVHLGEIDSVTVSDNEIVDNVTVVEQMVDTLDANSEAGGLVLANVGQAVVTGNLIKGNTTVISGSITSDSDNIYNVIGGGLGAYCWDLSACHLHLAENQMMDNLGAESVNNGGMASSVWVGGGGSYVSAIETVEVMSNTINGNTGAAWHSVSGMSAWGGGVSGGGLLVENAAELTLQGNVIENNMAVTEQEMIGVSGSAEGGGVALTGVNDAELTDNIINGNTTVLTGTFNSNTGEQYFPNGGGLKIGCASGTCQFRLADNTIASNTAAGAYMISGSSAVGQPMSGGIDISDAELAVLHNNVISGNVANRSGLIGAGAGMAISNATVTMTQNHVMDNQTTFTGSGQPALWVWQGTLTSTNDIMAGNSGGAGARAGSAISVSVMTFINDTFYDNGRVGIEGYAHSRVQVSNTLIISHEIGLLRQDFNGTVTGDYNLLTNDLNYGGGVLAGANDITNVDPLLVDPDNGDFHLSRGSLAIDVADDTVAPGVDFEDDGRPEDGNRDGLAQSDIGADEFKEYLLYMPLMLKS